VTADAEYELVLTPPARRALTNRLPELVAAAVIDFLTTALGPNLDAWASRCAANSTASGPHAAVPIACSTDVAKTRAR
jgi:hypothetical protein